MGNQLSWRIKSLYLCHLVGNPYYKLIMCRRWWKEKVLCDAYGWMRAACFDAETKNDVRDEILFQHAISSWRLSRTRSNWCEVGMINGWELRDDSQTQQYDFRLGNLEEPSDLEIRSWVVSWKVDCIDDCMCIGNFLLARGWRFS